MNVPVAGAPDPASLKRLGRLLRLACLLQVGWMFFLWGLWRPLRWPGVDYYKHWDAAVALFNGESLYFGPYLWMGFNYPQAAAWPFFWLAWFDINTGAVLWKLMLLAMLVACWGLGVRFWRPRRVCDAPPHGGSLNAQAAAALARHWPLTLAVVLSLYMPAIQSIYVGNIDPVNGLLMVALVTALLVRRERTAGVLWACVTLIKLMPVVMIVPAVLWRRWRLIGGFAATLLAYHLVLLAIGRFDDELAFYREIAPMVPRWWREISHAPQRFVIELCGRSDAWYWDPAGYMISTRIATGVLTGTYLLLMARLWFGRAAWLRAVETALIFLPFLTPLLEYHHFVYALPALLLQVRRYAEGRMRPRVALTLLAGWLLLQAGFYSAFIYSTVLGVWQYFPSHLGGFIVLIGSLADRRAGARPAAPPRLQPPAREVSA